MKDQSHRPSLAVIGGGCWGANLVRNFHQIGVLHTICDTDPVVLDRHRQAYPGVSFVTDFELILQNRQITQVVIATPAPSHFDVARRCLIAGKDVFVEKPLALSFVEGQELATLASAQQCVLLVGHLLQYHPHFRALSERVARGELGQIQSITSSRLNLGKIETLESALWTLAPHDISMVLDLLGGALPRQVHAFGGAYLTEGVADQALVQLEFDHGAQAQIHVSWLSPFKEQKLTVIGSKGMAVFDDVLPWQEKLTIIDDPIDWSTGCPVPQLGKGRTVEVGLAEPLRSECEHFLCCCRDRREPITGISEALRVMRVLQAADTSMQHGGEASSALNGAQGFAAERSLSSLSG